MSKRKRTDLSLAERYDVVKQLDQKLLQIEISKKLGVSTSQISRINAKKEEIRSQYESNSNPERKRQRTGKASDVEVALKTWFNDARTRDIPLSGPVLEEKAKDLAQALNKTRLRAYCRLVISMENTKSHHLQTTWREKRRRPLDNKHPTRTSIDLQAGRYL